jgi:Caspase domain
MSLLYGPTDPSQPGTHLLAIGVGNYPHLLGGTGQLSQKPRGLKQLKSPPQSLTAVLDWFLANLLSPGSSGFVNSAAPLASIEALASAATPFTINAPAGVLNVDAATRQNIQEAFEAWLQRLKSHPDNIGVFYFCGHGMMVSDHYLLAEDFGCSNALPWAQAFDISTTIRAVEREVSGTVFYFIDACREIARDVAMTLGADPSALLYADLTKKVIRRSVTAIYATGEGELAFAPQGGQVSRFTSALLFALSGYCGIKSPGVSTWNVDGESVAAAVRQLLEFEGRYSAGKATAGNQVSEQSIHGSSVPLLRLAKVPNVKVCLDLLPSHRRALYELYLESSKGNRVAQTRLDRVFEIDVPRGFYEVGAHDPAGALLPVVYAEEELTPPVYTLTFQVQ